jgi:histidine triad (HIT) family protein
MTRDTDHCTFCNLIRGAAEVSICHEDADAIAFMDIQPVNNGHILVVPREHHESLLDVPQELGIHLFKVTMRLANAMRRVTGCDDMNIVVNSGAAAGQDEPHYHVHIIPRREGDGFDIPLPFDGSQMPDRTVLDAYAARITAALRDPVRADSSSVRAHGKDASSERVVALPRFSETRHDDESAESAMLASDLVPRAPGTRREGEWRVHEGAHGELQYEPAAGTSDAA